MSVGGFLVASSVAVALKPEIFWQFVRLLGLTRIKNRLEQLPSDLSDQSEQCDIQCHQSARAEWFFEERDDRNRKRLSDLVENSIDKLLRLLGSLNVGCVIESPVNKMIHGGVLAMRVCFCSEINFAEDASFLKYQFDLPSKSAKIARKNPPFQHPSETTPEMITLFHVFGALVYYDENDRPVAHDDVHTKIEMCKQHFETVGLGADYVKQFIR
jgi:hypothetical protein